MAAIQLIWTMCTTYDQYLVLCVYEQCICQYCTFALALICNVITCDIHML